MITDNINNLVREFNDECNTTRLFYKVCKSFEGFVDERAVIDWCYKIIAKSKYVLNGVPIQSNFRLVDVNTKIEIIQKGFMEMERGKGKVYLRAIK